MRLSYPRTFMLVPLLVFSLLLTSFAASRVRADEHNADLAATITVRLHDLGLEFGAVTTWEASLYAGATAGEETDGRFSAWKTVADGMVSFTLPAEISEGSVAPWEAADNTYVRVRAQDTGDVYPTFDLVSNPFTLAPGRYAVDLTLSAAPVNTVVRVRLHDLGAAFGAVGPWEASLYQGAVAGQETGGRFTAWKPAQDGLVSFTLPTEVSAGNSAPWGVANDTYVRVRSSGENSYPSFDLVGRPFTLEAGFNLETHVELRRAVTVPAVPVTLNVDAATANVAVTLADLGLAFGAVSSWEASLYKGAVAGQETSGRFTAWKAPVNGVINFALPSEIMTDTTAPWGEANNTYVRLRATGDGVYPTFDLVSNPFTLNSGNYTATLQLASAARRDTVVQVTMAELGAAFGQIGTWEASLYAGATAGAETGGRFTAWKAAEDGVVTFVLPAEINAGNAAPWGQADNAYVRVRASGTGVYPTFDLVGRPFTLEEGRNVASHVALGRAITSTEQASARLLDVVTPTVTINFTDLGLPFGAVTTWEASLYNGATVGAETSGRFTAWKAVDQGVVQFDLPADATEGTTPWNEPENTYVRVRATGEGVYPTFDLVGMPFTLAANRTYSATMSLSSQAMTYTLVHAILADQGATFGQVGAWEASLYQGAVAGEEMSGRFTAWKPAQNGVVTFALPHEITSGQVAPWDVANGTYVRMRRVAGEGIYPTFDLVGAPFTLTRGPSITTQLNLHRMVRPSESGSQRIYLPIVAR